MSIFIQTAHAAEAGAAGPSAIGQIIMILGFVAIFYFLIWRPQSKRNKEHRAMINGVQVGNEVVFAGGLMGKIKKIDGDYAVIELNERNEVMVQKASIISVLTQGTIANLKN